MSAFRGMAIQPTELPLRPDWGKIGTPVTLRSNFFAVKLPKGPLYEYEVRISPTTSVRRIKRRIFELLEEVEQYAPFRRLVAHDFGAKLISAKKLPQPITFDVVYYDEDNDGPSENSKTYNVEFSYIQDIDLSVLTRFVK